MLTPSPTLTCVELTFYNALAQSKTLNESEHQQITTEYQRLVSDLLTLLHTVMGISTNWRSDYKLCFHCGIISFDLKGGTQLSVGLLPKSVMTLQYKLDSPGLRADDWRTLLNDSCGGLSCLELKYVF